MLKFVQEERTLRRLEPRFPEHLLKLQTAIVAYGNYKLLAKKTGVSLITITQLATKKTRFPWHQTVRALEQELFPTVLAHPPESVAEAESRRLEQPFRYRRISKCRRERPSRRRDLRKRFLRA